MHNGETFGSDGHTLHISSLYPKGRFWTVFQWQNTWQNSYKHSHLFSLSLSFFFFFSVAVGIPSTFLLFPHVEQPILTSFFLHRPPRMVVTSSSCAALSPICLCLSSRSRLQGSSARKFRKRPNQMFHLLKYCEARPYLNKSPCFLISIFSVCCSSFLPSSMTYFLRHTGLDLSQRFSSFYCARYKRLKSLWSGKEKGTQEKNTCRAVCAPNIL